MFCLRGSTDVGQGLGDVPDAWLQQQAFQGVLLTLAMEVLQQFIDREDGVEDSVPVLAAEDPLDLSTKAVEHGPAAEVGGVDGLQFLSGVGCCLEKVDLGEEACVVR